MYAYLMGKKRVPEPIREPTPEPEPEPEPEPIEEPEKKGKLRYVLIAVAGIILSKLKT
jgi:hypothetical protein